MIVIWNLLYESRKCAQKSFYKILKAIGILLLPMLRMFSENLYKNHFLKVALDEHHQLHTLMAEKQSKHRRHSACLKESWLVRTRTAKRGNRILIIWFKRFDVHLSWARAFFWHEGATNCIIMMSIIHLNSGIINNLKICNQWCCEAPTVPNGVGVWQDTSPNAYGKRWGNYLYISIQKRPAYADNKEAQVERAYLCWIESKFLLTWS